MSLYLCGGIVRKRNCPKVLQDRHVLIGREIIRTQFMAILLLFAVGVAAWLGSCDGAYQVVIDTTPDKNQVFIF